MKKVGAFVVITGVVCAVAASCLRIQRHGVPSCREGSYVLVSDHQLVVCENGRRILSAHVRLGRNGLAKRREGDGRTPSGTYALLTPRSSVRFGTFIPIGYPTHAQEQEGYTGSAIGIHGPHRALRWLGSLNTWFDSTAGCIGLADDQTLSAVATFVRQHPFVAIQIE